MTSLTKIMNEPLVHFCGLGTLLYALLTAFASPLSEEADPSEIIVESQALVKYQQFQQKRFKTGLGPQSLDSMDEQSREILVQAYVRDEALYREALSLGLDQNDEIIRRRLIQKMEYIAQGFNEDMKPLNEAALQRFYEDNKSRYRQPAQVSFTHVYLKPEANADDARKLLETLNAQNIPFEDAGRFGQRFLYHRNYINRSDAYISSHFGEAFQREVFTLAPATEWQGPINSEHGRHLVLIKTRQASRIPPLAEVAGPVLADAQMELQKALLAKAVEQILAKYTIVRRDSAGGEKAQ